MVLQAAPEGAGRTLPYSVQDGQGVGVDGVGPIGLRSCAVDGILPNQPGGDGPGREVVQQGGAGVAVEDLGDDAEQLEDLAYRIHHQLLVHACAIPGPFRQLRRTHLEHGPFLHHLEVIHSL